ncbi:MAG: pyrroline-5-carboxylate reductase [Victivallaceae bacterium]|nr:pyrroline-5-carboxylate reductase [Victivallaceae bacterium]
MGGNKILFIGTGKMATAIAGGMTANGFEISGIGAFDISAKAAADFSAATGVKVETGNLEKVLAPADAVIIAVKPQQISEALQNNSALYRDKLLISIAAGIKISTLRELSGAVRIIRVMPNTPALVGEGASAWCASPETNEADMQLINRILSSIGTACRVEEKQMDAVTGLSGSGPAYVLDFIQALADGGVNAGLPRETATNLAVRTVLGTAKLMLESKRHPAVLRDEVTSPGGTTAKALAVLEKNSFKGTIIEAVLAAATRSAELGGK